MWWSWWHPTRQPAKWIHTDRITADLVFEVARTNTQTSSRPVRRWGKRFDVLTSSFTSNSSAMHIKTSSFRAVAHLSIVGFMIRYETDSNILQRYSWFNSNCMIIIVLLLHTSAVLLFPNKFWQVVELQFNFCLCRLSSLVLWKALTQRSVHAHGTFALWAFWLTGWITRGTSKSTSLTQICILRQNNSSKELTPATSAINICLNGTYHGKLVILI